MAPFATLNVVSIHFLAPTDALLASSAAAIEDQRSA
jgi:hypothetical protein